MIYFLFLFVSVANAPHIRRGTENRGFGGNGDGFQALPAKNAPYLNLPEISGDRCSETINPSVSGAKGRHF